MAQKVVPVITIDGPSGTGKGTLCALLADYLGWHRLDSGALYRLLAYRIADLDISLNDEASLIKEALALKISFDYAGRVYLNAHEVTLDIRTEFCGQLASQLAAKAEVRQALLHRQRLFREAPGLVTDGRDMGTIVFPDAIIKFYLTASSQVRGERRHAQLKTQGICVSLGQVVSDLNVRDERDASRAYAPLKPADDAIVIDTSHSSVMGVFDEVIRVVKQHNLGTI